MRACKHCDRSTTVHDDIARAQGWRWYDGPTQGGGWLSDVACPVCAGTVQVEENAEPEWQVGCNTCHWEYETDDDGPLVSGKAAVSLAHDHECEPDVWIKRPADDEVYVEWDFDRDGNLRKPKAKPFKRVEDAPLEGALL